LAQSYRFGPAELRPAERQLLVEGRAAHIGARAFDVLVALVDRRDRVVTKDELLDLAWPGLVVEENNLHVQISALRKVLGANAVSTIAGRGFRFMAEVEVIDAPSSPATVRLHNLPAQLDSFVGREAEIAQLQQMLQGARLVTLTGSGGTGKTRLSLQAARAVQGRFHDGVWLVELAALSDPARVALAAAAALGVKEDAGRPVIETLARYARDRNMLLVLDNCEHLIQASAELAKRLLEASEGVRILASSREALRITGESVYPLPALAANDSARLFADRATAVHPGFRSEGATSAAVAEICRRLDGIPLAIELAAARVNALPVEQIAARLSDSLDVLKGGDRTSLTRQQTLRASIDWSYDLLSIPERELLRRLSVFAGGWLPGAAQAIATGGDVESENVLELLSHLVEKSLVAKDGDHGRYRLLDTVRQYARELLTASGEEDGVRSQHLDHYIKYLDEARARIAGPDHAVWMVRLDLDTENILAAHAWCDHAHDGVRRGFELTRGMKSYAINRGLLTVGHRVIIEALSRPGAALRDELRCRALFDVGQLTFFMGRYPEATRHLEESLMIARELDNKVRIAAVLQPLGMAYQGQGKTEEARATLNEALSLAQQVGSRRDVGAALTSLGSFHRTVGALDFAQRLYEESIVILVEVDDHFSSAIVQLNLAMISILRKEHQRARTLLLEAIAASESLVQQRLGLATMEVCAGFAAACGEYETATRFFGVAEAQNSSTGLHRDPADDAFLAPLIEKARQALGPRYRAAEDTGRALAYSQAISEARAWLTQ
jgi:predicted ATPase/DNA-binding winged helix-turn-helix (wHTH) protein